MSSLSGNVGASWAFGDRFVPYVNVSTAFETPTTTELVNKADGSGGFNPELGPQRAVNYEIGARGQPTPRVTYSVALFLGRVTDAIVQVGEIGGRAFFGNTGKTHNDGAEVGLSVTPTGGLTLSGAYTYARYRFASGPFEGNRLPGVPEHYWRLGLRTELPAGFFLDADHTLSSSLAADDANTDPYRGLLGCRRDQPAARLGRRGREPPSRAVPRREQPVESAIRRVGDAERAGRAGVRARATADHLLRSGDRVSGLGGPVRSGGQSSDTGSRSITTRTSPARVSRVAA